MMMMVMMMRVMMMMMMMLMMMMFDTHSLNLRLWRDLRTLGGVVAWWGRVEGGREETRDVTSPGWNYESLMFVIE